MPLSTVFSNKGVAVIFGIVWGTVIFDEQLTIQKVIATALIVSGIVVIGKAGD
jgi:multidrug transporter EmrE-like cation transporter